MLSIKKILVRIKPGVPKRYLLLIAAFMWLMAGSILVYRGEVLLPNFHHFWIGMAMVLIGGLSMFFIVFLKLSLKLIRRINAMEILNPCVFSFFEQSIQ